MNQEELNKKIAELEKQIEELKQVKVDDEKGWKPKDSGKYYFFADGNCGIDCIWRDDKIDNYRYSIGNCFKTKEEAEEFGKKLTIQLKYKKYVKDHSEQLDWNDYSQEKYYLFWDQTDTKAYIASAISSATFNRVSGIVYASSEQIIKDAIEYIGADNVKYLFED